MSGWLKRLAVPALAVLMIGLFIGSAQAVRSIEPTGETPGDVVVFPYYDVSSSELVNYFYLVNTVNYYVQAHVRFRTAECSIEVLDFDIILTPYDVFTFWVLPTVTDDRGVTGPGFFSDDSHTLEVSGLILDIYRDTAAGSVTIAFKDDRLRALHIPADDTVDMMRKGYVEVIVEGLIEPAFWNNCGPFDSLLEAANLDIAGTCTWDNVTGPSTGAFNNTDVMFGDPGMDHVGKTTNGTDVRVDNGELLYGGEFLVNSNDIQGYGVNALTITAFRTANDDCNTAGANETLDRHIDDNYTLTGWRVYSGQNGLILHPDYVTSAPVNDNPFFRPDWATTYGPTLAYGDDMDAEVANNPLVYGSVDDLEELWFNNMMNRNSRYTAFYWDDDGDVFYTHLLLNFFTKHYHYFTYLLYDPHTTNFTHGRVENVGGVWTFRANNRLTALQYNIDLPSVAPCGGNEWKVKFRFAGYDLEENPVPGTASPGRVTSVTDEVAWIRVGLHAPILPTDGFTTGWFELGDFLLDHDDARAEVNCEGAGVVATHNFQAINAAVACSAAPSLDFAAPLASDEIYDVNVAAIDNVRFVPAVGYVVVSVPSVNSDFKYDLTIENSPWAAIVRFNPLLNPLNGLFGGPAAP